MKRTISLAAAALAALTTLSACAPLVVGGAAVGGMLLFTDRRTSGAQLEDQSIELKARNRIRDVLGERGHVNATSYNRTVLLTGEVDNEEDALKVQQAIERIENVRGTVNELAATIPSSLSQRSNDVILSSKVKASFVDTKSLQANAFKVVTERGIVYLMGRVTEREAGVASEVARGVNGVQKVVRVFEIVSENELDAGRPREQAQPASSPQG